MRSGDAVIEAERTEGGMVRLSVSDALSGGIVVGLLPAKDLDAFCIAHLKRNEQEDVEPEIKDFFSTLAESVSFRLAPQAGLSVANARADEESAWMLKRIIMSLMPRGLWRSERRTAKTLAAVEDLEKKVARLEREVSLLGGEGFFGTVREFVKENGSA